MQSRENASMSHHTDFNVKPSMKKTRFSLNDFAIDYRFRLNTPTKKSALHLNFWNSS